MLETLLKLFEESRHPETKERLRQVAIVEFKRLFPKPSQAGFLVDKVPPGAPTHSVFDGQDMRKLFTQQEFQAYLDGQKIECIKCYRNRTESNLVSAKNFVEKHFGKFPSRY